ncbi:hypothetical protein [uncultured Luteimonas sp.]|uniref:hypothetical protein n=1 Tax=uncultured Luteimonas sp. TaxID=453144 RepID=UPI002634DDEE|nr:hypothetical protein [uncultured Luteimonas sp.]
MAASHATTRTGRAERVREYLRSQPKACTARELVDAIEPHTQIENMLGSLNTLVKAGHLLRIYRQGRPHFAHPDAVAAAIATQPAANDDARAPTASARIREWMASVARPVTSREVLDAVLPHRNIRVVSAMLASLVRKGHAVREPGEGKEVRFTCGRPARAWGRPPRPRTTPRRKPKPPTPPKAAKPPKPAKAARPAKAPAAPRPRILASGPQLTARDVPRTLAAAPPPARRRAAVACTLDGIPQANLAASDRIAADIAAFQARGGVIERIGTTRVLKHIGDDRFAYGASVFARKPQGTTP